MQKFKSHYISIRKQIAPPEFWTKTHEMSNESQGFPKKSIKIPVFPRPRSRIGLLKKQQDLNGYVQIVLNENARMNTMNESEHNRSIILNPNSETENFPLLSILFFHDQKINGVTFEDLNLGSSVFHLAFIISSQNIAVLHLSHPLFSGTAT